MLEIDVSLGESFDENTQKFVPTKKFRVKLEHSLVTLSKWESFWETPFLGREEKTTEQTISYIQMMLLEEIPPEVFQELVAKHSGEINKYIEGKMTATKIHESPGGQAFRETITSELIYYWMISMQIPVEFQHWHLNRLITLIRVINVKNSPKKKMSVAERRALNRQRQSKYNTRG